MAEVARVDAPDVRDRASLHGVTAADLIDLRGNREFIAAAELERWMLAEGLAEQYGGPGTIVPTALAFEIAARLDFLG